ncbi:MAG: redoxin family protein [Phycisphaerales bacterium]|nr:redoxin family protein [Phycisphaerales bacterium]
MAASSPEILGQSLPRTPANAKPKPAETQPATTTPAEKKPAETKPAETKPADKKPAETKPQDKPKNNKVLEVGSPAPRFEPDAWIKGQSVSGFEKGKVYVVEFWATWCGPCRESIPHLTKIQKDNKELIVIGMASYERQGKGSGQDTRRANVEKFVKDQGDKMDYRVAFETDDQVGQAWMDAAKRDGIPTAFIVDGEGKIAYIGSPMSGSFDSAVQSALKAAKGS